MAEMAIRAIERAAVIGGWELLHVHISKRSWYVKLGHKEKGYVIVRISDHKGNGFKCDLWQSWCLVTTRSTFETNLNRLVARLTGWTLEKIMTAAPVGLGGLSGGNGQIRCCDGIYQRT